MAAVVGFSIVATLAIVVALVVAGPRYTVRRDPTLDVDGVAGRLVGVMSALGAFAVTALVFLVTQARTIPDANGTPLTTALTMFVVAYMGYLSSALLFANVSHRIENAVFDLAAAQYAGRVGEPVRRLPGLVRASTALRDVRPDGHGRAGRLVPRRGGRGRLRAAGDGPVPERVHHRPDDRPAAGHRRDRHAGLWSRRGGLRAGPALQRGDPGADDHRLRRPACPPTPR